MSFGEEAGEEEAELATMARPKAKSVFDASGAEDGGRIVKPGSEEEAAAVAADAEELARSKAFRERMRQKLAAREAAQAEGVAHESDGDDGDGPGASGRGANEAMEFEERMRRDVTERRAALDDAGLAEAEARATAAEDKTRRKEEKAERKAKREEERRERETTKLRKLGIGKARLSTEDAALMTEREARRWRRSASANVVAGREKDMLAKLAKFQNNLKGALKRDAAEKKTVETEGNAREGAAGVSRFVSEGLYYAEEEEEDDGGDWKAHALSFVRDERKDPHAYLASMDDYVVEDPLLEKGKGKFAKADKAKKRENAWAGGVSRRRLRWRYSRNLISDVRPTIFTQKFKKHWHPRLLVRWRDLGGSRHSQPRARPAANQAHATMADAAEHTGWGVLVAVGDKSSAAKLISTARWTRKRT